MKHGPFFRSLGAIGFVLSVLVLALNLSFKSIIPQTKRAQNSHRQVPVLRSELLTNLDSPQPQLYRGSSVRTRRPIRSSVHDPFLVAKRVAGR